jgi:hypothetical protein
MYEINAVGGCVHLLAAGKEVYTGAELNKKLRKIESHIKDSVGKRIFKVSPLRSKKDVCSSCRV